MTEIVKDVVGERCNTVQKMKTTIASDFSGSLHRNITEFVTSVVSILVVHHLNLLLARVTFVVKASNVISYKLRPHVVGNVKRLGATFCSAEGSIFSCSIESVVPSLGIESSIERCPHGEALRLIQQFSCRDGSLVIILIAQHLGAL